VQASLKTTHDEQATTDRNPREQKGDTLKGLYGKLKPLVNAQGPDGVEEKETGLVCCLRHGRSKIEKGHWRNGRGETSRKYNHG